MFLCHFTYNCNTVSAILTGATFNKKWALQNPRQQQLKCILHWSWVTQQIIHDDVCELRLNETEKRQFHMYERKELVRLNAPWYSPSGHWSKMKGATHSSDFPGWHWTAWEGTAAFLRVGRGKGSGDGASVTWSPHSLGRSHHQTLHSQARLSSVLSIRLQVQPLSSSSFLCFAVNPNKKC